MSSPRKQTRAIDIRDWKSLFALLLLGVTAALLLGRALPAEACGGPSYADLGVLGPVNGTLELLEHPDPDWSSWGNFNRDEFRFLYPFLREDPKRIQSLWGFSHKGDLSVPAPSSDAFDSAVERGDWEDAERQARALVDTVLDLPPVPATQHAEVLWRAVEYVELRSLLGGFSNDFVRHFLLGPTPVRPLPAGIDEALEARWATPGPTIRSIPNFTAAHPRAASLALWTIQRDLRTKIPDGYADAVKDQVAAATWSELEGSIEQWRKTYPHHPLADYALLWKVRTRYFAGDTEGAWQVLFDMYPRHLPRVLAEMRYLLVQGKPPSAIQLAAVTDPVLTTAFTSEHTFPITQARFESLWSLAEKDRTRPWAINLEERLLLWAARNTTPGKLPKGFPTEARSPTSLWGKLRAAALAKSGDYDAARAQIESVPPDAEQARLAAQIELARGRADLAAMTPNLSNDSRSYLLRVRLDEHALERLAARPGPAAKAARFEISVRLAAGGQWLRAAKHIEDDDPPRAKLWREAGALAKKSGAAAAIAFARFLEENQEALLYEPDPGFYRAISDQSRIARPGARESAHIEAALTRGTARWLALKAYARALQQTDPRSPDAEDALADADRTYNRLINWAGGAGIWATYAPSSAPVQVIRKAGKAIRQQQLKTSPARAP